MRFILACVTVLAARPIAAADPPTAEVFEKEVRPLLVERCQSCHGDQKQKGGLKLTSRAAVLRGGESGPAAGPGQPEESLLVKAVRQAGDRKMPPKGRLTDREIATLARWVADGLPWPEAKVTAGPAFTEEQRRFWSFQPVRDPAPPIVKDTSWVKSPLDRFILAGLEAKHLKPAVPADKRTLIRRATYDLTGLPPTPEEINAFLGDESPDAFAQVVDRLLASPAYGERWGRHWLDLARYTDSFDARLGPGDAMDATEAWRYRDWVVNAFNRDLPYDQFIRDQVAGDVLPGRGVDGIVATGLLAIGNWGGGDADKEKLLTDIADDQLDVVCRTFLGLTVACARCHDHKFDPITTEDYYGLAGIFFSTHILENVGPKTNGPPMLRVPLATADPPEKSTGPAPFANGAQEGGVPGSPQAGVHDVRVHVRGSYRRLGELVPRRFPTVLAGDHQTPITAGSGRRELAAWLTRPDNPLTARVMVNRICQHHFGEGIVRTPSNFGQLGERPTHPELLDWLASRFLESGWSVKAMHRLIVLSSTYQQACTPSPEALRLDPDNRLGGRANRRRLEAEELRDGLLAASGRLDRTPGGPAVRDFAAPRRTLYLRTNRSDRSGFGPLFDAADPTAHVEKRTVSTVAPQALFLMNHPFVKEQARALAERLLKERADEAGRIGRAYELLYGRPPTVAEAGVGREFLAGATAAEAWVAYYQILMCSNEAVYVD